MVGAFRNPSRDMIDAAQQHRAGERGVLLLTNPTSARRLSGVLASIDGPDGIAGVDL